MASAFWDAGTVHGGEQLVPACAWFATAVEADIVEHATVSREFRTMLSMLWIPRDVSEGGMSA